MLIIGNWNYAGTQKFVSHAVSVDGLRTLCGMNISDLMARRGVSLREEEMRESNVLASPRWQYFSKLYHRWIDALITDRRSELVKYGYRVRDV